MTIRAMEMPLRGRRLPALLGLLGLMGAVVLVMTVVLVPRALPGALLILLAVVTIGRALWNEASAQLPQAWPHLLCMLLCLISLLGFCASRCGAYAAYASVLSLPTALVGGMVHGGIALVLVAAARGHAFSRDIAPELTALAAGGSLFYGLILISGGSWCGACVAIHGVMLAQVVAMLRKGTAVRRIGLVLMLLGATGGINALYHHRLVASRENDADRLLAYLRGAWSAESPPQAIEPMSQEISEAISTGSALRAHLRSLHDHPAAQSSAAAAPASPAPAPPAHPLAALRAVSEANRWGSPSAPVTLLVGIDSGCPVCAQEFAQLLELHDLVEHGEVQLRFLLSYRTQTAQAMASLSYVGGLLGERQLVTCLGHFYQHQHEILLPADAVAVLPQSMPAVATIGLLRRQHEAISALLADADNLKQHLGATGDPTLWLERSGHGEPERTFHGLTMSAILRLAIISLEPAVMAPVVGSTAGMEATEAPQRSIDTHEDPLVPAAAAPHAASAPSPSEDRR